MVHDPKSFPLGSCSYKDVGLGHFGPESIVLGHFGPTQLQHIEAEVTP